MRLCYVPWIRMLSGDLSSERVYVRLQTMTYRRGSGIIETPVQGFVTGTGQAGVRGTAVEVIFKEIDQICVKQPLILWPPTVLEEGKDITLASIPGGECEEVDDNEVILINFRCWQKQLRSANTRLPFRLIVTGRDL